MLAAFRKARGLGLTRVMLLIAVMIGLFFSNAEGVRLLPFPDGQESANGPGRSFSADALGRTGTGVVSPVRQVSKSVVKIKKPGPGLSSAASTPALRVIQQPISPDQLAIADRLVFSGPLLSNTPLRGPPAA